jgi:hypothetical protein
MEKYVRRENVKRFRELLAKETDESRRLQLQKLLAEEEAKPGAKKHPKET